MSDLVSTFSVKYDGRDADAGTLRAEFFGESIIGASKLYTAVSHYSTFGFVPRGRYRKSFACYVRPAAPGSVEQLLFIAALAGEYGIHSKIYNEATSYIFKSIIDSLKSLWTRPRETDQVVEQLTDRFTEKARTDNDVSQLLANGMVKSNTELISVLRSFFIDTLPQLADTTRPHAKKFVQPVGETCSRIVQFPETSFESLITESDAEVIRGDAAMEVDPMAEFKVNRISEIDIRTGHCVVDVEGIGVQLKGKITDPVLETPNNVYTSALNSHAGFKIRAKAVRKDGEIKRLYISDSVGQK